MKKKHYLSKKEEERIASKYSRNRLYCQLRPLALRVEELSQRFSLSAADLFYHVSFTLDTLLELATDEEGNVTDYCTNLWYELRSHFAEKIDCDDSDHELAASLVVCATSNVLVIGNRGRYWDVCDTFMQSMKMSAPELREKLESVIEDVMYEEDAYDRLHDWMVTYTIIDGCLSDKIADEIFKAREGEASSQIENADELVAKLKYWFWDDVDATNDFINRVYGRSDEVVISEIVRLFSSKPPKILKKNKKRLHEVLNGYKIYNATSVNFSNHLKEKGWGNGLR